MYDNHNNNIISEYEGLICMYDLKLLCLIWSEGLLQIFITLKDKKTNSWAHWKHDNMQFIYVII